MIPFNQEIGSISFVGSNSPVITRHTSTTTTTNNIRNSNISNSHATITRSTIVNSSIEDLTHHDTITRSTLTNGRVSGASATNATTIVRSTLTGSLISGGFVHRSTTTSGTVNDSRVHRSDLTHVKLLVQSTASRSNAVHSTIQRDSFVRRSELNRCTVSGSSVHRSKLNYCDVENCVLSKTDFSGMVLKNGVWKNGRLVGKLPGGDMVIGRRNGIIVPLQNDILEVADASYWLDGVSDSEWDMSDDETKAENARDINNRQANIHRQGTIINHPGATVMHQTSGQSTRTGGGMGCIINNRGTTVFQQTAGDLNTTSGMTAAAFFDDDFFSIGSMGRNTRAANWEAMSDNERASRTPPPPYTPRG